MCGNAGIKQLTGGYTPGPSDAERQAMIDAPRLASEAAAAGSAQSANAKLAARNARRSTSLLATGGNTPALMQTPTASKTVLGA
jgi:hypothetical protein